MHHAIKKTRPFISRAQMVIGLSGSWVLSSCTQFNHNLEIQTITKPSSSVVEDQKLVSTPLVLETKGGHQIYFDDPHASWATVKENTSGPFKREPLRLPVHKAPDIQVEELAKKAKSLQHYKVHVCFPEQDARGVGYVYVGDVGLQGGVKTIYVEEQEVIEAIIAGYAQLGREAETLNNWKPFIAAFTGVLRTINFELSLPSDPNQLDPGNIRARFTTLVGDIMGRRIQLDNYGLAWYDMIRQIRSQLNQRKRLNIDPSQYPIHSYSVRLTPNVDKMIPLIVEMDNLYAAIGTGSNTVSLDFSKLLGSVDVTVYAEDFFFVFENIQLESENSERERQENARKAQIRKVVYSVSEELANIEASFMNLKNQLQELASEEGVSNVLHALKVQHAALMSKLSILDDLAGADEATRAEKKSLVTKILAMLDETDRLLKELATRMEIEERMKQEQLAETLFLSPTGLGIRNDRGGRGCFLAPRGVGKDGKERLHQGIDFSSVAGQNIVAPLAGKVRNFKGKKTNYPMLQLWPSKSYTGFDYMEILYVNPRMNETKERPVQAGEVVGTAADLQKDLKYQANVGPHVHVQMFKNPRIPIDPTPFFREAIADKKNKEK